MRALLKKELLPFLGPGIAGMVLFTGLWVAVFDVESAFLASPDRMLVAVVLVALNVGALLGYAQLAVERDGTTLSYLVHRDVSFARVLAAKCVAGWALLAAVVLAPVLWCALIERSLSPLGAVLQWGRVGEIALGGLVFLPAHALGMFVATLRPAFPWRVLFGVNALGGLGGAVAFFLDRPIAAPGPSRVLFTLGCVAIALGFLAAARRSAARMDDEERAPAPFLVAAILAAFALLIVAPGHGVVSIVQRAVLQVAAADQPSLAWHADLGAAVVTSRDAGRLARSADGARLVALSSDPAASGSRVDEGWIGVWHPDGRLARELWPDERRSAPTKLAPSIVDPWTGVEASNSSRSEDGDGRWFATEVFRDHARGRFLLLRREYALVDTLHNASWYEKMAHPISVSLRGLVRGDGRRFALDSLVSADNGVVTVDDPSDGTSWACNTLRPDASFQLVGEGRYRKRGSAASPRLVGRRLFAAWTYSDSPPANEPELVWPPPDARVRCEVEGDPLASTVRVLDAQSGEALLRQDYGLHGTRGLSVAAFVLAAELLRAPLAVVGVHLFQDPHAVWTGDAPIAGWLTGGGRRPLLVLAIVALAALLALRVRRELVRRGTEPWRRRAWIAAVLCIGFPAWLAYLLAEPAAPRIAAAARARRPLLLQTREVGA